MSLIRETSALRARLFIFQAKFSFGSDQADDLEEFCRQAAAEADQIAAAYPQFTGVREWLSWFMCGDGEKTISHPGEPAPEIIYQLQ